MTGTVAQWIGTALVRDAGVRTVFGVPASGNAQLIAALTASGATFVEARHEAAAAVMADAFARVTGELGVLTVGPGAGLTSALTGLAEAAKSRTPLLVLAAEDTDSRSGRHVDQAALAAAIGVIPDRVTAASTAPNDLRRAYRTALIERRTVLLSLPLEVQAQPGPGLRMLPVRTWPRLSPSPDLVAAAADALAGAERPVFIAGRGARKARQELADLAERCGALVATSTSARGLFRTDLFNLDLSGRYATPVAAELLRAADLVLAWGCALSAKTTRDNTLIAPDAVVIQVDANPGALSRHYQAGLGIPSDAGTAARALIAELTRRDRQGRLPSSRQQGTGGYRTPEVAKRLAAEGRWRDIPFTPQTTADRIDPRTLTIALDDVLPPKRTLVTDADAGAGLACPLMFLTVPDEDGLVFTQAFEAPGLGLATGIGAALGSGRLTVATLDTSGALRGASELETAARLGLGNLLVVVYDTAETTADLTEAARAFGYAAATVRSLADLAPLTTWLTSPQDRPMLLNAKVTDTAPRLLSGRKA